MTVQKGSGFYHVGQFNTNRIVRISVVADIANAFATLMGADETHPFTTKIASPTTNQYIQQARFDAVVRAISVYAVPVGAKVATTNNASDTVIVEFETARSGVFFDTNGANVVTDLSDTRGMADRSTKTKDGIQTLLNSMKAAKSLDGTTLLFAINAPLADGTASTVAAVATLTASVL